MALTFLFTDIEGSTRLWETHPKQMEAALAEHDSILRQVVESHSGQVFKTVGDAFCCVFSEVDRAIEAAISIQKKLATRRADELLLRVRVAIHLGPAQVRDGDYFGPTLNRVARLLGVTHGGQILISSTAQVHAASAKTVDLGEHLLKDLDQPMRVYQVLSEGLATDFPALRSLPRLNHNLPIQITSFVGRTVEMATLEKLVTENRLVTLTGTGGAGKTRLATQCAAELIEQHPEGVWIVELAPLTDPGQVSATIARTLRIAESPGVTMVDSLIRALQDKSALIILDNCEHLIEVCADVAEALIRQCPNIRILATSREPLGVPGEQTYRIPSLGVSPDEPGNALALFLDRAALTDPNFALADSDQALVAGICKKLDGIPLAIELAAACCRTMSVEEISTRLDDQFRLLTGGFRTAMPRQRTLRAMVDWSYDRLTQEEKGLLCRLAVFSGGWTLSTVSQVFGHLPDLVELHSSLVNKSLVLFDAPGPNKRFRLLQTIRDYALERLVESGQAAEVRQAHQSHFIELVRQSVGPIRGPDQQQWLDRLELEHDNIRAALQWSLVEGDPEERGLTLCGDLFFFWWMRSHWAEGRKWCTEMLAVSSQPSRARSECLMCIGNLALFQGDYAAARTFFLQHFEIIRDDGDAHALATAKHSLAHLEQQQGNYEVAKPLYEESLVLRRASNRPEMIAGTLNNLANVEQELGNFDRAAALHAEALEIRLNLETKQGVAQTLQNLGSLNLVRGDLVGASDFFERSLAMVWPLRDTRSIGQVLDGIAEIHLVRGEVELATTIWSASRQIRLSAGTLATGFDQSHTEALWQQARQLIGTTRFEDAWNQGLAMNLDDVCRLVLGKGN